MRIFWYGGLCCFGLQSYTAPPFSFLLLDCCLFGLIVTVLRHRGIFWWYFEKAGFNVIELLLDISLEYINQLHIDAEYDNYLLRRITERFFIELENIFYRFSDPTFSAYFIKKIGVEEYDKILDKINEYRDIIISYQKGWIRKQQEIIDYFDKK
jgi:hypothetical protein